MKRLCSTTLVLLSDPLALSNLNPTLDTGLLGSASILNLMVPVKRASTLKQALKWKHVYSESGSRAQPACPGSTAWSRESSKEVEMFMMGRASRRCTAFDW